MRWSVPDLAMAVADTVSAALPSPVPERRVLADCRLIAHRGEHDNVDTKENTLAAFRAARGAGVWGIECDIRWTADLVPVVCHDPTPRRIFGLEQPVSSLRFADLRAELPQIPALAEVVAEFGGNTHLMLELKAESWPQPQRQHEIFTDCLRALRPVDDFHLLALDCALFERVAGLPAACCVPVAEASIARHSRLALARGYGGFAAHYLLLSTHRLAQHKAAGQHVGSGFSASRNCLFRELNRGVDWIFSNRAVALQRIRDEALARSRVGSRDTPDP